MAILDRLLPWRRQRPNPAQFIEPSIADPLIDLPLRREAASDAYAVRRQGAQESLGMTLNGLAQVDPDEGAWRRLSSGQKFQRRDLTLLAQDRMLEVSWFLWEQNPFAKRLVTLMTDLILGEGVTVQADDERIQEQIDKTWNHPINQVPARIREFHNFLSLTGELILPMAQNDVTGRPVFGFIDPYQVKAVHPLPDNILIPDILELKPVTGAGDGQKLKIVRPNPATGKLEGEVLFFAINKLPNSLRGRSDLLPLADWLDLYDQYLFGEVERLGLLSAFVWDYTITGADEPKIAEKLSKFPNPKPGAVFAHNENETLEARTPDLKASDRSEVAKLLRIHLAGSMGYPLSYLGDIESNKATIEGQNDVMMKTPAARQKEFAAILGTLVQVTVEGTTTRNPSLFRGFRPGWKVQMPEIAAKDISRVGAVLASVVTANDTAIQNETMSKKAAIVIQAALIRHLGVDLDTQEMEAQIEDERQERQDRADDLQAQMAARRATNPNPPIPGDDTLDDSAGQPGQPGQPAARARTAAVA